MIKIVSFDLDGTLIDWTFANSFWFDRVSRLYAERRGVSYAEALQYISRRYDEVGMDNLEWYDIDYWWKEFDFTTDWKQLVNECRPNVRAYPDSRETLEKLHRRFKLIVISNSLREFAEIEIEESGFKSYFDRIFSATSDFGVVKKTGEFYLKVLKEIDASPSEVVHIGDNWVFDYLAPREAGIQAFCIDREGKQSGEFVVRDLKEFSRKLLT